MRESLLIELEDYNQHQRDAALLRLRSFARLVESGVDIRKLAGAETFAKVFDTCDFIEKLISELETRAAVLKSSR